MAKSSEGRVLFIANGNGEDSIAAEIIKNLPPKMRAEAWPVVGEGRAYLGVCPVVGPHVNVASQGWRHTKGSLTRDLKGGVLGAIPPALSFMRGLKRRYEKIVVVGDGVVPLVGMFAGLKIDIYLDVFKSGYAHQYNPFERFVLARTSRVVFCRDDLLAASLRVAGIDGRSEGNIMLDTVTYGDYDMRRRRGRPLAVTLLPGSRKTTGESLAMQVDALFSLPEKLRPDIFVALASGISPHELAEATGLKYELSDGDDQANRGRLAGGGLVLHLAEGATGNLLEGSDIVLSQAGTATQQALGLGKPVITIDREDNRRKRMADEQKLMGESRILVTNGPAGVADNLQMLLEDAEERERLGRVGRERLGGPGTLAAVVAELQRAN